MTVNVVSFTGSKNTINVVCKSLSSIEHLRMARESLVLDRHLKEMTGVVKLVLIEVIPAFVLILENIEGDQESIILLGCKHTINDALHSRSQTLIFTVGKRHRCAFQHLVEIRIKGGMPVALASNGSRGNIKVGDVTIFL